MGLLLAVGGCAVACGAGAPGGLAPGETTPLRVYAAASLVDLLEDLRAGMATAAGRPIALTTASSGALARQIREGAPADLFISADEAWMDELARAGLLAETVGARRDWLRNGLVCIVPRDSRNVPRDVAALASGDVGAIALAAPGAPVGAYARQALEAAGVLLAGRVVEGRNARDTLAKVTIGAVPAGIVYRTDALAEPRVTVAFAIDPALHAPIVYPAAVLARAVDAAAAARVLAFLTGAEARQVIEAYGFGSA